MTPCRCLKATRYSPLLGYSLVDPEADISKDIQRPKDVVRVVSPYDVSPDDQRFVMIRLRGGAAGDALVVVENFFEELKERVGR